MLMKFLVSRKLATHISIITTTITFAGMLLLWLIVSNRVASMGKNNITSQMISLRIQMIPLFCGRSSNIRKILPHSRESLKLVHSHPIHLYFATYFSGCDWNAVYQGSDG